MALYDKTRIADATAKMLIEVGAVLFNAREPFILTSGRASPVYIDCRKLISFPRLRSTLVDFAASVIVEAAGYEGIDAVAGGETAGIPYAAWIADRLGLPMQYVRKKPKGFGRNAQIEGHLTEGHRVLLVEDLATDAGSKVNFCKALREAGATVEHAFVIFHYGIFPQSVETMREIGVDLHSLATWWDVLRVAKQHSYFDPSDIEQVEAFLHGPVEWSAQHGGKHD
ncbi:MAG: orotate phosphoribosyltransferase [Pseudomonadota bacterium]